MQGVVLSATKILSVRFVFGTSQSSIPAHFAAAAPDARVVHIAIASRHSRRS